MLLNGYQNPHTHVKQYAKFPRQPSLRYSDAVRADECFLQVPEVAFANLLPACSSSQACLGALATSPHALLPRRGALFSCSWLDCHHLICACVRGNAVVNVSVVGCETMMTLDGAQAHAAEDDLEVGFSL